MIPNEEQIVEKARGLDYTTPFFYASKKVLEHNYKMFTHLFDNAEIYYALKANSDPKILVHLNELGCGFEAASAYEIELLISLGVSPLKIVYGTSVKPLDHIQYAHKVGIDRFAADSKEEIEKIAANAPGSKVFIRTIVNDTGSVFTMSERFGSPIEDVKDLVILARRLGLQTYGISFYVGSQATQASRWAEGIDTIRPIIEQLLDEGIKLEMINIGGGFPVIYNNHKHAPNLEEIVTKVHNALHKLPYMPKIIMEPGRGIVATSTVLVAQVISRSTRYGKTWLCLDAGIYNALYEAMMHQGATKYNVHPVVKLPGENEMMRCVLAGPTGDSLDVITRDAQIPSYIAVGDKLIFENAGAYTIQLASAFNGFPKPELYFS